MNAATPTKDACLIGLERNGTDRQIAPDTADRIVNAVLAIA